jgi:2,3-bisphosphoglycerate-independent phosphoglycerate mutase
MVTDMKLNPHPTIPPPEGPVLVAILDGWGANAEDEYNAVAAAPTPTTDALKAKGPSAGRTVYAHGTWVGLPSDADMGNSEVGHNALGSGQVIDQGARLVDLALSEGHMFSGDGWKLISKAFSEHTLHFIGLLSDGGVHSRYDQLIACVRGAAERGAKKIRVHALADGRDVPDGSSLDFFAQLKDDLASISKEHGVDARIASGGGRMVVSMDRYEADWEMVKRGWHAHVLGKAPHYFEDAVEAVRTLRGTEESPGGVTTDQYLPPFVIVDSDKKPVGTIEDSDAVVLFNFRADRMVELSKAFEYEKFDHFERERWPKDLKFVGMMQYDGDLLLPKHFLVPPPEIRGTSGEYLSRNGITTFACSETQKFGHVTFFWNGNRSGECARAFFFNSVVGAASFFLVPSSLPFFLCSKKRPPSSPQQTTPQSQS